MISGFISVDWVLLESDLSWLFFARQCDLSTISVFCLFHVSEVKYPELCVWIRVAYFDGTESKAQSQDPLSVWAYMEPIWQ